MTNEDEVIRGNQAKRILDDKMYTEAHTAIRDRIVDMLGQAETTGDKRQRLNDLLIALTKIRGYLEQVMVGGKLAAQSIEHERTLKDRILRLAK